jgi:hypothetical protein
LDLQDENELGVRQRSFVGGVDLVILGVPDDCLEFDAHGAQSYTTEFNIKKRLLKQLA